MAKRLRFGRRRSFPLNVHRLSGAGLDSSTFFGTRVSDLTEAFHGFRDEEAFQRLADGDPESFIAYGERRMSSLLGPARETMKTFVARAKNRIETEKADAGAVEKYTRTNDHEEYLNYLVGRLAKTSDEATRNKIENQMLELRSRIHRVGSGGESIGPVGRESLVGSRQKFDAAKLAVEKKLRIGDPISDKELDDLNTAAGELSELLQKIESDPGLKLSVRQAARTERLGANGPELYPVNALETNDKKILAELGLDAQGRSVFAERVKNAPTLADKAKLLVDRAGAQDLALSGLRTSDQQRVVAGDMVRVEEDAKTLFRALTGPRGLPEADEAVLNGLYQEYVVAMRGRGESPVSPTEFRRSAREAQTSADFSVAVKYPGNVGEDIFNEAHAAVRADAPAAFDLSIGDFTGSDEAVADARAAVDLARRLFRTNSGIFDAKPETTEDFFRLAQGKLLNPYRPGGPLDESVRAGRQVGAEEATEPAEQLAPDAEAQGRVNPFRQRTTPEAVAADESAEPQSLAEQYLGAYEPPDLPETPDEEEPLFEETLAFDMGEEETPDDDLFPKGNL